MAKKNTLLAALLEKMSPDTQKQIVKDLNEFIRSNPANATNIELESLREYHGIDETLTPEQKESQMMQERMEKGLHGLRENTFENLKKTVNIQEM